MARYYDPASGRYGQPDSLRPGSSGESRRAGRAMYLLVCARRSDQHLRSERPGTATKHARARTGAELTSALPGTSRAGRAPLRTRWARHFCENYPLVCIASGAGCGYGTYRALRMLASLFPPLWPTIPANAAIPMSHGALNEMSGRGGSAGT